MNGSITDVPGIKVGHASDFNGFTGCTVILCENGAVAGVDIRGSATGTREIDPLREFHIVRHIHAICLSGGSAFGLDAAGGVMRYLEEKGYGFDVGITKVPIVPTAIIFDLNFGSHKIRPTVERGYEAACNAKDTPPKMGSIGVGTGATVGKIFGKEFAMKGGVGTSSITTSCGLIVGALVVVNAFGDIIDPKTGKIIAGARSKEDKKEFVDTAKLIKNWDGMIRSYSENTTLGVVATNAKLTRESASKVAQMAQNGFSKSISPAFSLFDGDVIFVISFGELERDINLVGLLAEEAIEESILLGIKEFVSQ